MFYVLPFKLKDSAFFRLCEKQMTVTPDKIPRLFFRLFEFIELARMLFDRLAVCVPRDT